METITPDVYGRHAENPNRPAALDGVLFGRPVRYPWALIIDPEKPKGRHRSTGDRPPGVYFERNGLVYHTGHLDGYWTVSSYLRHGEKPLPRLRSARS